MLVKEVLGSELLEGDIIRRDEKPFAIRRLERTSGTCFTFSNGVKTDYGWNGSRFLLLHRPWPEGKTEESMLVSIWQLTDALNTAMSVPGPSQAPELIKQFREALDAYELGKPDEETGVPPDSTQDKPPDNSLHRSRAEGTDGAW